MIPETRTPHAGPGTPAAAERPARTRSAAADLVVGSLALAGLALFLVRYAPTLVPGWDDAYFFSRPVCVNRAVAEHSSLAFRECFRDVRRSPLLALVAVPFGRVATQPTGLGLVPVSLAVMQWVLAVAFVVLLLRLDVPRWLIVAVAAGLGTATPLTTYAGRLLADHAFLLTIGIAFLLVPLEARAAPRAGAAADVRRGLLWGVVLGLGALGKATFLVFAAVLGAELVFLRWRAHGARAAARTVAVGALATAPAAWILKLCWEPMSLHAQLTSFGVHAKFGNAGFTPLRLLGSLAASAPLLAAVVAVLVVALPVAWRRQRRAVLVSLPALASVCVYEVITLLSPNQDVRYQFPTLIGLPLALLVPWVPLDGGRAPIAPRTVLAWVLAGILLAIPMSARYDVSNLVEQARILDALPAGRKSVVLLATDSGPLNTESLSAALELSAGRGRRAGIDTVVYDEGDGRDFAFSLRKIARADYMILDADPRRLEPEWTNRHADEFRRIARTQGRYVPELSTRDIEVYAMHGAP